MNDLTLTPPPTRLSDRVRRVDAGGCTLLALPTPAPGMASFHASFPTRPNLEAGDELVQELVVALLDKGTRRKDRFEIADLLDAHGTRLHFSSEDLRVNFSGQALREHLNEALAVAAEQLAEPRFDADEFVKAKLRLEAGLRRAMEDTGAQSVAALARTIYPAGHPNHARPFEEEIERLSVLTLDEVITYHARHFGRGRLTIAVAGDFEAVPVGDLLSPFVGRAVLEGVVSIPGPRTHTPGRTEVSVPDRQNADVRIGHGVPLLRNDPRYRALSTAVFALGGNFSSRLMASVRDVQGLTYGINAWIMGAEATHAGHFQVGVTLSPENLERGIEATRAEIARFCAGGLTEDELEEKKTTITGTYQVGLATTDGIAARLLQHAELGFGVGHLDELPDKIRALTLDEVNEAIAEFLHPDALHTSVAGTF